MSKRFFHTVYTEMLGELFLKEGTLWIQIRWKFSSVCYSCVKWNGYLPSLYFAFLFRESSFVLSAADLQIQSCLHSLIVLVRAGSRCLWTLAQHKLLVFQPCHIQELIFYIFKKPWHSFKVQLIWLGRVESWKPSPCSGTEEWDPLLSLSIVCSVNYIFRTDMISLQCLGG